MQKPADLPTWQGPCSRSSRSWATTFAPSCRCTRPYVGLIASSNRHPDFKTWGFRSARAGLGLGPFEDRLDAADLARGVINPLKTGINFADVVTTVSPTYAREIRETPLGMGMQEALGKRRNGVIGILNVVDYREWDP